MTNICYSTTKSASTKLKATQDRTDLILKSAVAGAIAIVVAMVPLAKMFGPAGIASAFLVSTICQSVYTLARYRELLKMPIASFYPFGRLIQVMAIAFGCIAVSGLAVSRFLDMADDTRMATLAWKLAVAFAASAVLYVSAVAMAGFIRVPSPAMIRERIRRAVARVR